MKINSMKTVNKDGSRIRAIASVVLDNNEVIKDIRIVEGDSGLFIAMPTQKCFCDKDYDNMSDKEKEEYNQFNGKINEINGLMIAEYNRLNSKHE